MTVEQIQAGNRWFRFSERESQTRAGRLGLIHVYPMNGDHRRVTIELDVKRGFTIDECLKALGTDAQAEIIQSILGATTTNHGRRKFNFNA